MKRQIIKIDEDLCDGCGLCIPECKEGALQIIEGKARLVSDLFCDGLGACIGHCPQGAITIEEREAEPYDERKVMESLVNQPKSVIQAHLKHLADHGAMEYHNEAVEFLKEKNINPLTLATSNVMSHHGGSSCPGSRVSDLGRKDKSQDNSKNGERYVSELNQWPVQLHLVRPEAPYFKNSELVVMSTCGPIATPAVHQDYLKGRAVVVACPKLDYTDPYAEKLSEIFKAANTPKVIVVIMEVPCCRGLSSIAVQAAKMSGRKDLLIEEHTLSLSGDVINKQNLSY